MTSFVEHIPSYELLTTPDGQLVIRVEGQTLQVPRDLPRLSTLVNPSMLMVRTIGAVDTQLLVNLIPK